MIIAIPSEGTDPSSPLARRLGRADYFLFYNNASGEWRSVDNRAGLDLAQGAGVQAAQTLTAEDAQVLLSGHCGPRAFRALAAAGISVCTGASGTVSEVLEAWQAGHLEIAAEADVDSHWL